MCLNQHQLLKKSAEQTVARYTVDVVAGTMAVYGLSNQNILTQAKGVVSSVSMADIATKVTMATAELGMDGVCNWFEVGIIFSSNY